MEHLLLCVCLPLFRHKGEEVHAVATLRASVVDIDVVLVR